MRAPSRVLSPATLVPMSVLAIDAGTTGVTALIVTADGTVASRGYQEFRQYYPEAGRGRPAAPGAGGRRGALRRGAQSTRDRGALGPRHARRSPARDRLAGQAV